MMRLRYLIFLFLLLPATGWSMDVSPFDASVIDAFVAQSPGQAKIIHVWGVSCSECVVEMPRWAKFLNSQNRDRILFLQVDPVSVSTVRTSLQRYGFKSGRHYTALTEMDERQRYKVHHDWFGETPVTIFIHPDGTRELLDGTVDFGKIHQILERKNKQEK